MHASRNSIAPHQTQDRVAPRRALVVLGMHRSGTSALTRVLSLCGATLPKHLMPAVAGVNDLGFWESTAICAIHDALLTAVGSAWDDPSAFPTVWFQSAWAAAFKQCLLTALHDEYGVAPLIVIKDPRICRLVPLWLSVLEAYGAVPAFVIPVRNPLEVAASLQVRNGLPEAKSLLLWLRHFLAAEYDTRGFPRTFTSYHQLLQDWRGVVDMIGQALNVGWSRRSPQADAAIAHFLSPWLRHHMVPADAVTAAPHIVPWVKTAFDWALRAAHGRPVATAELDAVRAGLDAAELAFMPLVAAAEVRGKHLATLVSEREEQMARLTQEVDEREEQITNLTQTVVEREAHIAALYASMSWRITAPLRAFKSRVLRTHGP